MTYYMVVKRVIQPMSPVEQERPTHPENLSSFIPGLTYLLHGCKKSNTTNVTSRSGTTPHPEYLSSFIPSLTYYMVVKRVIQQMSPVEQDRPTHPENLSSFIPGLTYYMVVKRVIQPMSPVEQERRLPIRRTLVHSSPV